MNRKLDHKSGRNVGTIANVDTIEGIARVGTISEYLALSESGFGSKLGQVGIIQGWIWITIWQSWHYPKVDLGQNWARQALSYMLAISKCGFGPHSGQVDIIQGWIWSKIGQGGHYRTCWHYPRVDLGPKWSILVTVDAFKGGSGRQSSQVPKSPRTPTEF